MKERARETDREWAIICELKRIGHKLLLKLHGTESVKLNTVFMLYKH